MVVASVGVGSTVPASAVKAEIEVCDELKHRIEDLFKRFAPAGGSTPIMDYDTMKANATAKSARESLQKALRESGLHALDGRSLVAGMWHCHHRQLLLACCRAYPHGLFLRGRTVLALQCLSHCPFRKRPHPFSLTLCLLCRFGLQSSSLQRTRAQARRLACQCRLVEICQQVQRSRSFCCLAMDG